MVPSDGDFEGKVSEPEKLWEVELLTDVITTDSRETSLETLALHGTMYKHIQDTEEEVRRTHARRFRGPVRPMKDHGSGLALIQDEKPQQQRPGLYQP